MVAVWVRYIRSYSSIGLEWHSYKAFVWFINIIRIGMLGLYRKC